MPRVSQLVAEGKYHGLEVCLVNALNSLEHLLYSLAQTLLQSEVIDLKEGHSFEVSDFLSLLEVSLPALLQLLFLGYLFLVVDLGLIDEIAWIKFQFGCFEGNNK